MIPRGIRLNNPGNIRHEANVVWAGQSQVQTDPDFVQFSGPGWGIRAIVKILHSYQYRHGIKTLRDAIARWAPNTENDTDAYLADVCERCSIGPDDVVDFNTVMPTLVKALIWHEQGQQPYTDTDINQAIAMAGQP